MDIKNEALKYANETFRESRDTVFFAMETIISILFYAKENGILALAKDDFFRNGQMHILDVIEKRKQKIINKNFLMFGLNCLIFGYDFGFLKELLENKFYVSCSGKETYIAYIYFLGIMGIAEGLSSEYMFECFRSIIPDSQEEEFEKFEARWKLDEKSMTKMGRIIQFEKKNNK